MEQTSSRRRKVSSMVRSARIILSLLILLPASAQDRASRFVGTYSGRSHCGGVWTDFQLAISPVTLPLGIIDPDAGVTAVLTFYFRTSVTSSGGATYHLTGQYDAKTGRFRLDPQRWNGPHPAVFEMIGIEGRFDPESRKITGKMLSSKCDAVELVPPGVALPALPAQAAPQPVPSNPARPEQRLAPSNVTNYLDVAAYSPDFEYFVTAWFDPPGTVHEKAPIEEAIDRMKQDKFACVGSQHVTWDASGLKGTSPDGVGITERYVIECVGDCKGVTYRPWIGANVTHFGLSEPLPTLQIKSTFFGGTTFRWNFSRTKNTQPPPGIYVHRWKPTTGFGPFDRVHTDAELSGPGCRAPKTRGQ
jgi:hypothetical protein